MSQALKLLGHQMQEIWKHFGPRQKMSTMVALGFAVLAVVGLLIWSARPDYRLLYAGLSLEDAAAIRERLDDEQIGVDLRDSGRALYVESKHLYRARLLLAAEGLPGDVSTGFELFEEPKFGLTDFAQKINFQRALQGELERTIATMDGIDQARVMLVLPKDRLFASEEEKKASASVLLTLGGGTSLSHAQVRSITQLIGASVPGLTPRAITVSDQFGNMLSARMNSEEVDAEQAREQIDTQRKVEALLASKAQDMLDRTLGPEQSIVRVNVSLDFSKREKRQELFDKEGRVVRSETISTESSSTPVQGGGDVAGVVANIPVGSPGNGTIEREMSTSKREDIQTEYAIPSGVEHMIEKGSRVTQISVSAAIAMGEEARSPVEMEKIENMIRGAVGLVQTPERQDTLDVVEMAFAALPSAEPVPFWHRLPFRVESLLKGLSAGMILLVVYLFFRRATAGIDVQRDDVGVPVHALTGEPEEAVPDSAALPSAEPVDTELEALTALAKGDPGAVASWISGLVAHPDE